jgi:hypothetical protein
VFWYAFFEEKCILDRFFGPAKKCGLQPARAEPLTKGAKTGHLFDTAGFASGGAGGHFPRNLLTSNGIGAKSARREFRQNLVTYNNMVFKKAEKEPFCTGAKLTVDKKRPDAIIMQHAGEQDFYLLPVRHAGNGLGWGYFLILCCSQWNKNDWFVSVLQRPRFQS